MKNTSANMVKTPLINTGLDPVQTHTYKTNSFVKFMKIRSNKVSSFISVSPMWFFYPMASTFAFCTFYEFTLNIQVFSSCTNFELV